MAENTSSTSASRLAGRARALVAAAVIAASMIAPSVTTSAGAHDRPGHGDATRRAPVAPSSPASAAAKGTVCLVDVEPGRLDTLFDTEPGGVVGADYQRALTLPDGRVFWTFQDAAVRLGSGEITIVHNIAVVQDNVCFTVMYGGSRTAPRPMFFADRTTPYERWFWPLDAAVGDDGRVYVYTAEMEERGEDYLTTTLPVGTWVAVFDPAAGVVVAEERPPDSSASLYGWSITSDDRWTYLYAHCYRQFGFDEYALVAAFDRSCAADVTVARVPRGKLFDPMQYWDGASWQPDPARATPVIDTQGRRVNANQFEWTGERFLSVNKEGDWWGRTILLSSSTSPTGPFHQYDEITAPLKCAVCNSFFASIVPVAATRRASGSFVISLSHNRWDGVVTSLYRPTFHDVDAPQHLPAGASFELEVPAGTTTSAINVVAVDAGAAGFVTVHPCAAGRPLASNLNYRDASAVSNLVLARPDDDGRVCLYSLADTELVVDLSGSFSDGSAFQPVDRPVRLVDTRIDGGRVPPGGVVRVEVPGGTGAAAVALNVTAVAPAAAGHLTAFACDRPLPPTSNINHESGSVVSNLVVVGPGADGSVCISSLVETDIVVDLAGTFGAGFVPSDDPVRLADTRIAAPRSRLDAGGVVEVEVPEGAGAAVLNVVAVLPDRPGFLTVHPCASPRPLASNVNYIERPVVSNLVVAASGGDGRVCVYSSAGTDVVVDLFGVLLPDSGYDALPAPARVVDTRIGTGVPGELGIR